MFCVYDKVWIMENNKPVRKIVYAIIESMNHLKDGTEKYFQLVNSQVGANDLDGNICMTKDIFTNKEALLRSLAS